MVKKSNPTSIDFVESGDFSNIREHQIAGK